MTDQRQRVKRPMRPELRGKFRSDCDVTARWLAYQARDLDRMARRDGGDVGWMLMLQADALRRIAVALSDLPDDADLASVWGRDPVSPQAQVTARASTGGMIDRPQGWCDEVAAALSED